MKKVFIFLLPLLFLFSLNFAFAQSQPPPSTTIGGIDIPSTGLPNPDPGGNPVVAVLTYFLDWILTVFVILSVIALVGAGIMYITSAGGDRKETAKNWVIYSIIGIVVGLSALIILQTIEAILG